jgi:CDP-glucose 4,6-dehydratase
MNRCLPPQDEKAGARAGRIQRDFWRNRRVFVTGHTGFKGSWLCLTLARWGAEVTGFALPPPTTPSLFALAQVEREIHSIVADLRDAEAINRAMREARSEIVLHLAAQPLVRASYADPLGTYATNVMGLAHLLEAARHCSHLSALVVVTSDKCYENREWLWGYREEEALGGHDPYSNSKACAELLVAAWRRSFFSDGQLAVATARAGNVIGGGDWARDRLVPDLLEALAAKRPLLLRHPEAVRPWQHVLDPLHGYLLLAERLHTEGAAFAEAWNFGPAEEGARPVCWLVETLARHWPAHGEIWMPDPTPSLHEAGMLKLDAAKARARLAWQPRWPLPTALEKTAQWYRDWQAGMDMRARTLAQIEDFFAREAASEDAA